MRPWLHFAAGASVLAAALVVSRAWRARVAGPSATGVATPSLVSSVARFDTEQRQKPLSAEPVLPIAGLELTRIAAAGDGMTAPAAAGAARLTLDVGLQQSV